MGNVVALMQVQLADVLHALNVLEVQIVVLVGALQFTFDFLDGAVIGEFNRVVLVSETLSMCPYRSQFFMTSFWASLPWIRDCVVVVAAVDGVSAGAAGKDILPQCLSRHRRCRRCLFHCWR